MSGCWLWMMGLSGAGYGVLSVSNRTRLAHRVSFEVFRSEVPTDRCVCHRCDVRCCVNPDHLWLGTAADNARDSVTKGRWLRGEQHPRAKLADGDISEIRRRVAAGDSTRAIAADFGTTSTWVSKVARRLARHLGA